MLNTALRYIDSVTEVFVALSGLLASGLLLSWLTLTFCDYALRVLKFKKLFFYFVWHRKDFEYWMKNDKKHVSQIQKEDCF